MLRIRRVLLAPLLVLLAFTSCRLSISRDLSPGDVRGQVVVLEGGVELPLAGARVTVAGTRVATTSDARGRFRLSGLRAGSHDLRVAFTPAAGEPLALRLRDVTLEALGGERVSGVDLGKLVLGRVGALDVTVVDGDVPLPGARVAVESVGVITVDGAGKGRLGGLPAGPATLVVEHVGETRRGWGTFDVTVTSATVTAVTLDVRTLPALVPGNVTGTVEQEGNPDRVGFTVTLVHPEGDVVAGETDVDGRFVANDVPPGLYTVVIVAPDGAQLRAGPVTVNGDVDLGAFLLLAAATDPDRDADDLPNDTDPCPDLFGNGGGDLDADGLGDACDPDVDGDGIPNADDFTLVAVDPLTLETVVGTAGLSFSVRVMDGNGTPRRGISVDCIATDALLPVDNATVVTDSNGVATCTFSAGTLAGTAYLVAGLSSMPTLVARLVVERRPGPVASLDLNDDLLVRTVAAGTPFTVSVKRLDTYGNLVTAAGDVVTLASNDPQLPVVGEVVFDGSEAIVDVPVTLFSAGLRTLVATLPGAPIILAELPELRVTPGAGAAVQAMPDMTTVPAGVRVTFQVDLVDAYGNRGVTESRAITLDLADPLALTFGILAFDGSGLPVSIQVEFGTAGNQEVTFGAEGVTSAPSRTIHVDPATRDRFVLRSFDTALQSGVATPFEIVFTDRYGNLGDEDGELLLSFVDSTDPVVAVQMRDGRAEGSITPSLAGTFTLRLDWASGPMVAGFPGFVVAPGPTAALVFVAGGDPAPGVPMTFTVEARDAAGNVVVDDARSVTINVLTLGGATYPGTATLSGGRASFDLVADTPGPLTVSAILPGNINGSRTVTVSGGPFDRVVDFAAVALPTAWVPVTFRARAVDAAGRVTAEGAGRYQLRCDDPDATLPAARNVPGSEAGNIELTATLRRSGTTSCELLRDGLVEATTSVTVGPSIVIAQDLALSGPIVDGVVPLQFRLRADAPRPVDVRVEWSFNGTTWFRCSTGWGTFDPRAGLPATPDAGTSTHVFRWAAWRDLPARTNGNYHLRVSPRRKGASAGTAATLNPVAINLGVTTGAPVSVADHANVVSVAPMFRELDGVASVVTLESTNAVPTVRRFDGTNPGTVSNWSGVAGARGVKVVASPKQYGAGAFAFATAQATPNQVRFHTSPVAAITVALAWPPTDLALGDLDRDGDVDAVVMSTQARGAWIRNDRGAFVLQAMTIANAGTGVDAVVTLADFSGDAFPDALFGFGGSTSYVEYRRVTEGVDLAASSWTNVNPSAPALRVLTGRFDGDRRDDVAVLGATSLRMLPGATLRTLPTGIQSPSTIQRTLPATLVAATAGDVDNDGRDDVVVVLSDRRALLYAGSRTEANTFAVAETLVADVGAGVVAVALADFSRDGTPDLVVSTATTTVVHPVASRKLPALRLQAPQVTLVDPGIAPRTLLALDTGESTGLPELVYSSDSYLLRSQNVGDAIFGDGVTASTEAIDGFPATMQFARRVEGKDAGLFSLVPAARGWSVRPRLWDSTRTTGTLPGTPVDGATADFDRDGTSDLAVLTTAPVGLYVILKDGTNLVTLATNGLSAPKFVSAGDFDGDGDADLLVHNDTGNPLQATNDGLAGFSTPSILTVTDLSTLEKPQVADFDRNGADDLLVHRRSGQVLVFRGGAPAFSTSWSSTNSPTLVAVTQAAGDFDGDGDLDVTVSYTGGTAPLLVTYAFSGTGFGSGSFGVSTPGFSALLARDVDHDGRDDLVGLRSDGVGLQVIRAEGGLLGLPTLVVNNMQVRGGGFVDVARDGVLDLVAGSAVAGTTVFARHSAGLTNWSNAAGSATASALLEARVLDVTGDGQDDFVGFGSDAPGVTGPSFHVLPGDRNQAGLFAAANGLPAASMLAGVALADFRERGLPDAVLAGTTSFLKLPNLSTGGVPSWGAGTTATLPTGNAVLLREWRADATLSPGLFVAHADGTVRRCLHTGALAFSCATLALPVVGTPQAVLVANVDADPADEVLLATDQAVYVGEASGNGLQLLSLGLPGSRRIAAADLDRDGDLDLVGATTGPDSVVWIATGERNGAGDFSGFARPMRFAGVAGANGLLDATSRGHVGDAAIVVGGVQSDANGAVRYLPVAGRQY